MCLAVPGRILGAEGDDIYRKARVDFAGVVKTISLACVPDAAEGDWVLVHAGIAITQIDEAEAAQQLDDLRRILSLSEELAVETREAFTAVDRPEASSHPRRPLDHATGGSSAPTATTVPSANSVTSGSCATTATSGKERP